MCTVTLRYCLILSLDRHCQRGCVCLPTTWKNSLNWCWIPYSNSKWKSEMSMSFWKLRYDISFMTPFSTFVLCCSTFRYLRSFMKIIKMIIAKTNSCGTRLLPRIHLCLSIITEFISFPVKSPRSIWVFLKLLEGVLFSILCYTLPRDIFGSSVSVYPAVFFLQ